MTDQPEDLAATNKALLEQVADLTTKNGNLSTIASDLELTVSVLKERLREREEEVTRTLVHANKINNELTMYKQIALGSSEAQTDPASKTPAPKLEKTTRGRLRSGAATPPNDGKK